VLLGIACSWVIEGHRYYPRERKEDEMGRKKKPKPDTGYYVIGRRTAKLYWDGEGWVEDFRRAIHYEWCRSRDETPKEDLRKALTSGYGCDFHYVPPAAHNNEGDSSARKNSVRLADGFFVLVRVPEGGYWDGEKWVEDTHEAEHYLGAPTEDLDRAERDRDRLNAEGVRCCILVVGVPKLKRRVHQ
jgi:hypothetical protein